MYKSPRYGGGTLKTEHQPKQSECAGRAQA